MSWIYEELRKRQVRCAELSNHPDLLTDLLPDDPGHLVAVELDHGVLNNDTSILVIRAS